MNFVYSKLIWKQGGGMNLKRATRSLLLRETRERQNSKEMEEMMLQSRKRERNSHVNIDQRMIMMKTIVGNFIVK
jgi:hypothetical protein